MNDSKIEKVINEMTLEQKIGQLFLLAYPGKNPEIIYPLIKKYKISGCYISQDNAETFAEASTITYKIQNYATKFNPPIPMLLAVDQEGAWGILVPESTTGPGNLALGAADDLELTEKMYNVFGNEMLSVGFNALLAPCADVDSTLDSSIIGTRSFGSNPKKVADHVVSAVRGAKRSGSITTLKHFPGHGATEGDTHRDIPIVKKEISSLFETDLLPFEKGIKAGADIVMTSHIKYPEIDPDNPATMSKIILQNILRKQLKFDGVILSDSMNMGAIKKHYNPKESTIKALKAGVDIVMFSEEHYDYDENYLENQLKSINAVKEAVEAGELTIEEINEKIRRILNLKFNKMKIRREPLTDNERIEFKKIEQKAAEKAIKIIPNKNDIWPLDLSKEIICVNPTPKEYYNKIYNIRGIGPNQKKPAYNYFKDGIQEMIPKISFIEEKELKNSTQVLMKVDTIILITEDYPLPGEDFPKNEQQTEIKKILNKYGDKSIVFALRSPYERNKFPENISYICTFSSRACSAIELAKKVYRESKNKRYLYPYILYEGDNYKI